MKKKYWILIVVGVLVFVIIFLFFKDEEGHHEQERQQTAIIQAKMLYEDKKQEGMEFSSQCLGVVGDKIKYAVDIVHNPRTKEDNLIENQCGDYRSREVENFIELDKDGNMVRIV